MTGQNLPPDLAQQAQADHSRFLNQYAPSQPLWIARPAELPDSDLTNAFTAQQPGGGGGADPLAQPPGATGSRCT